MEAKELVKFLKVLRLYVAPYWRSRIEEIIVKIGGKL